MTYDKHFDMHEDIAGTHRHLSQDHHVTPEAGIGALGHGAAEVLAYQHERLHRKRYFFTFGRGMYLIHGVVREASSDRDVPPGLPLGGHYVTILASDEMMARSKMLAAFGHFASVFEEQRGHEVVQRYDLTPLLAGGDLE